MFSVICQIFYMQFLFNLTVNYPVIVWVYQLPSLLKFQVKNSHYVNGKMQ